MKVYSGTDEGPLGSWFGLEGTQYLGAHLCTWDLPSHPLPAFQVNVTVHTFQDQNQGSQSVAQVQGGQFELVHTGH